MAELVNQRFADRNDDLFLVIVAVVFDRMLKQRDAIGKLVAVAPAAFVERRPLVEAEQGIALFDFHFVEQIVGRLVLDHDREIAYLPRELQRNRVDRFLDEFAELLDRHRFATLRATFLAICLCCRHDRVLLTGLVTMPVR